jgi:molybdopterin/thiamine biosynthesis adenylyltransferase
MLERYSRQMLFGPIGQQGQKCLQASTVMVVGCGALGTVLANNLCRAGIGHLVIADRDYVELNNLQRQILFDEDDVTQHLPKAVAAAEHLRRVNSHVKIEALVEDIHADGIESLVREADLVVDATDNFETRYLINDVCNKYRRPWIYSGVIASYGVTMNIIPGDTPCLRCVFPEMPLPGTTLTCVLPQLRHSKYCSRARKLAAPCSGWICGKTRLSASNYRVNQIVLAVDNTDMSFLLCSAVPIVQACVAAMLCK